MKRVLLTGANGFVGQHVANELAGNQYQVIGVGGHDKADSQSASLESYHVIDLTDPTAVDALDFHAIDYVIHLAGLAAVGPSFDQPLRYIDANMGMEINLYEAALKQQATPMFLIISSGSLYAAQNELPITEQSTVAPSSPYAISKLGQEQLAQYYAQRGIQSIIARPFNHIGPGQGLGFIVPDLAQQIVAVEQGTANEIKVGNLDAQRDYTDVRDIAVAYHLLLEKGHPGETYNICSGTALSGHDILSALTALSGVDVQVVADPAKMRPSDNPVIYGNPQKLCDHTGWERSTTLEQTMQDVIADWRANA